jgi:hypothetical protein
MTNEQAAALAAPFPVENLSAGQPGIGWKPQAVMKDGSKAMAVPFIDARDVMRRLDEVLGPTNWKTEFMPLGDGNIMCTLSVRDATGGWVPKTDVGGPSDQPEADNRMKAAFSEALKRAAVQLGVGRYLYAVPEQWVAFDAQKKRFTAPPVMPAWALPKGGKPQQQAVQQPVQQPAPVAERTPQAAPAPAPAQQQKQPEPVAAKQPKWTPQEVMEQKNAFLVQLAGANTPAETKSVEEMIMAHRDMFNGDQLTELRAAAGKARERVKGVTNVAKNAAEVLGAVPVDNMPAPY